MGPGFQVVGAERPPVDAALREPILSRLEEIPQARRLSRILHSLMILIARASGAFGGEKLNVLFLLARRLSPCSSVVAEDYVLRMFLCVVATLCSDASNGAQQIIKGCRSFVASGICGLGLNAYLFQQISLPGVITAFQALLLLISCKPLALVRPAKLTPGELYAEFSRPRVKKRRSPSSVRKRNFGSCRSARDGAKPSAACCASRHFKRHKSRFAFGLWSAA